MYLAFAFDVSGSMGKGDKPWHDRKLKWDPVVSGTRSFFEDPGFDGYIVLCPDACRALQDDVRAELAVDFECEPVIGPL